MLLGLHDLSYIETATNANHLRSAQYHDRLFDTVHAYSPCIETAYHSLSKVCALFDLLARSFVSSRIHLYLSMYLSTLFAVRH